MQHFYQFIVPLTFLAIWALTSLFNREAQPLPPRSGRRPGEPGPRPGNAPKPGEWRPESVGRASSGPTSASSARASAARANQDEIIILESETRRPSSSSPASRANPKRSNRGRPAQQPARRAEPTPAAKAPGMRSGLTDAAPVGSRTQGLSPLSLPPSPLLQSEGTGVEKVTSASAVIPAMPLLTPDDVRLWLQTPGRLREAMVLNELLKPPISVRHGTLFARRRQSSP